MIIDGLGYLARKTTRAKNGRGTYRNWWLVWSCSHKHCGGEHGVILMSRQTVSVPKELIGKRVRFKVEIEDD